MGKKKEIVDGQSDPNSNGKHIEGHDPLKERIDEAEAEEIKQAAQTATESRVAVAKTAFILFLLFPVCLIALLIYLFNTNVVGLVIVIPGIVILTGFLVFILIGLYNISKWDD